MIFQSGESWYAVPAASVSEIVELPSLRRLPGSPPHVLGVFVHRAEVIPAIDFAMLTGKQQSAGKRAVLVRTQQGTLGIIANEVAGMSTVVGSMEPLGSSGIERYLRGPARAGDKSVVSIDVDGLAEFLSRQ